MAPHDDLLADSERDLIETGDHSPCRLGCGKCSQCFHAAAFAARGGRPYLGAEREAQLASGGDSA